MKKLFQRIRNNANYLMYHLTIPLLITLIVAVYFAQRMFIFIHPGEAGVFWSRFFGGTEIKHIYGEGFHLIFPWDEMHVYNVRIQELSFGLDVLTKTGLQVNLDISTRYAPDYALLGVLHQKVGPDYATKVIIPEIESVLREIIGTMDAEQIYTTGREVIVEAINQAIEQISQRYIVVDKVLITKITLPESVAQAIRYKTEQKHLIEANAYKVQQEEEEAKRKRIEGEGVRDQFRLVAEALRDERVLKWRGIEATLALAKSNNAKVIVIGSGQEPFQLYGDVLKSENGNFPNLTGDIAPSATAETSETPGVLEIPNPVPTTSEDSVLPPAESTPASSE